MKIYSIVYCEKIMKLLIGCGKMGGAILDGWLQNGITDIVVLAKTAEQALAIKRNYQVKTILSCDEIDTDPEIILCAVKPYHMQELLPQLNQFNKTIFISVVVGKSIEYIRNLLGNKCTIVRAIPNIPCLIKQGVIGLYSEHKLSNIDDLLSTVGKTFWLKNEQEIEIVAALPGGLPAFFVKILKIYAKEISMLTAVDIAIVINKILQLIHKQETLSIIDHILNGWTSDAILLGLEEKIAQEMLIRTVIGTISLLQNMSFDEVIEAVASKKGTTEAGLLAMKHGLSPIIAAHRRALEINNISS